MLEELPEQVADDLLTNPLVAHLATATNDRPHVAPLWFQLHGEDIEVMTTGTKLANIRENPRVSVSIQKDDAGHPEWMVCIQGTANVIDDDELTKARNRELNRKYGAEPDAWLEENSLVRIEVGSVHVTVF